MAFALLELGQGALRPANAMVEPPWRSKEGVVTLAHPCPAEITFAEMRESAAQTSAATIRSL
jgi:hypothetical protein